MEAGNREGISERGFDSVGIGVIGCDPITLRGLLNPLPSLGFCATELTRISISLFLVHYLTLGCFSFS